MTKKIKTEGPEQSGPFGVREYVTLTNPSRARKTIDVADMRSHANRMLAAKDGTPEGRIAIFVLLERVLMDTGNYRGFNYLGEGNQAGEIDDTRRRYH